MNMSEERGGGMKVCYICQRAKTSGQDKNGIPICSKCQEEHSIKAKEEEYNLPPLFAPGPKITAPPADECPLAFEPLELEEIDLREFDDDPTPVLAQRKK